MVDAADLKSVVRKDVPVQVRPGPPPFAHTGFGWLTPVRRPKLLGRRSVLRSFSAGGQINSGISALGILRLLNLAFLGEEMIAHTSGKGSQH